MLAGCMQAEVGNVGPSLLKSRVVIDRQVSEGAK